MSVRHSVTGILVTLALLITASGIHAQPVTIDSNNRLIVDGKPFFPIGLFQVQGAYELYPEMRDAGINVVQMYSHPPLEDHDPHVQKELDELHKYGIKMVLQMPLQMVYYWPREEREAGLQKRIDKFGKHPALLSWYIADEPDLKDPYDHASPETLKATYDYIKLHDPDHPVSICLLPWLPEFPRIFAEFAPVTDIMMTDPYIGWIGDGSRDGMLKFTDCVDAAVAACKGKMPYWVVPGIFDESKYQLWRDEAERGPNYREVRCQTFIALARGAQGVIYWNLGTHPADWVPEHRGTWHGVKAVTKEMSEITPVLLAAESDKEVRVSPRDKDIHLSLREVDGSYYLMAINGSKEKRKLEFDLPWIEAKSLKVISEDRTVPVTDGKFADDFGRYEVHIYTTAEKIPQLPTSKQIEAKCEQLDREFEESRKGNLAAAKDVIVEASSSSRRATSAVDGIFGSAWSDATPDVYPDWWQIDFRAVKEIRKIVIDSNLVAYDVLAWDNGQWKTVEKVEGSKENRAQEYEKTVHEYAEPLQTDKIRIVTHEAFRNEQAINEVEFYQ